MLAALLSTCSLSGCDGCAANPIPVGADGGDETTTGMQAPATATGAGR